jgi:hypothetical protein
MENTEQKSNLGANVAPSVGNEAKYVQEFFKESRGDSQSTYVEAKVAKFVQSDTRGFYGELLRLRDGMKDESNTSNVKSLPIGFTQAIAAQYGCDLRQYMASFGAQPAFDTLEDLYGKMGGRLNGRLTEGELTTMLEKSPKERFNGTISSVGGSAQVPNDFTFLIPEFISALIYLGYEDVARHLDWIGRTVIMPRREMVQPYVLGNPIRPYKVAEGGTIPVGAFKLGKKKVNIHKYGVGFSMTSEMVQEIVLDGFELAMRKIGEGFNRGADALAMNVLVNGDQADLSESAAVIGVENTTNGFQYLDWLRVEGRMEMLGHELNHMIAGLDATDLVNLVPQVLGFDGNARLLEFSSMVGPRPMIPNTRYPLPTPAQLMFIDTRRALAKLMFGNMTFERQYNPETQTTEMFVTEHVGFSIDRRDARLIVNPAVPYSSNSFPSWMNVEAQITQGFQAF